MSAGKLNTEGANSTVISTYSANEGNAIETKTPKGCKHRWGMWDMPMIMDRLEPFNDHMERVSPRLIQYRQCLECGEARARNVKY